MKTINTPKQNTPAGPVECRAYICNDCEMPCMTIIMTPWHMRNNPPTRCTFQGNCFPARWIFKGLRPIPENDLE